MSFRTVWGLLKEAVNEWVGDKAARLGAALSYYTIFAIPPLFVIVIFVASLYFDEQAVRTELLQQVGGLVGAKGAEAIESALNATGPHAKGLLASILAIGALILTSTGLFIELQSALNTIWGVEPKPGLGIWSFIKNRLLSFSIVIGIGFLLLVSLVISAALSAMARYVSGLVPGLDVVWMIVNFVFSFAVVTVLFAMIFKVLPDVRIAWRDVWIGATFTALLFTLGKFLLGLYLGRNATVSAYGAAGSLVLILLWVYYSAQILFFGAELTQVYANRFGAHLQPKIHARWMSAPTVSETTLPANTRRAKNRPGVKLSPGKEQLLADLRADVERLRATRR
jgi:membrane protein